jgi:hypothetical protein
MAADYDADVTARRAVVIGADAKLCGYMAAWPDGDAYFIENMASNRCIKDVGSAGD